MTYYKVGKQSFTDYGRALTFARCLNKKIEVVRTKNVFKYLYASI